MSDQHHTTTPTSSEVPHDVIVSALGHVETSEARS